MDATVSPGLAGALVALVPGREGRGFPLLRA